MPSRFLGIITMFFLAAAAGFCDEPEGPITLERAILSVLAKNPDLNVYDLEMRALRSRVRQMKLLPNPNINIVVEDFGGSGSFQGLEQSQTTFQLNQLIETGGKRRARTNEASFSYDLAVWDYEAKRIEMISNASKSYAEVLGFQKRVALAEEMVRLAEEVVAAVTERVKAGKVSSIEAAKARVALSIVRLELDHSNQDLNGARRRLAALWGSSSPSFTEALGSLEPIQKQILPLDRLVKRVEAHPELARWEVEIAQRQSLVKIEKSKEIPDLTLHAGFRRLNETDDDAFLAGLSFPLPLFDRNQGAVSQARSKLEKARQERKSAELRIKSELSEAYRMLLKAHNEQALLKKEVLPEAQNTFEAVKEGYRLGKFTYIDVLDAQKTLFESKLKYLEALVEYHKAVAEMKKWTGSKMNIEEEV